MRRACDGSPPLPHPVPLPPPPSVRTRSVSAPHVYQLLLYAHSRMNDRRMMMASGMCSITGTINEHRCSCHDEDAIRAGANRLPKNTARSKRLPSVLQNRTVHHCENGVCKSRFIFRGSRTCSPLSTSRCLCRAGRSLTVEVAAAVAAEERHVFVVLQQSLMTLRGQVRPPFDEPDPPRESSSQSQAMLA